MGKITFSKAFLVFSALVGLLCAPNHASAQRGGGGHGGGGFRGGGGDVSGGGHFSGGSRFSGGGMHGGGPWGRSFSGPRMHSPMGGSNSGFSRRFNRGRSSGPSRFNDRSFRQGGGAAIARPPAWNHFAGSSTARNYAAGMARTGHAIADGQWHSFAGNRRAADTPGAAYASGNAGTRSSAEPPRGPASAATPTALSGARTSSASLSRSARNSSLSTGRAGSNLQGSRINRNALTATRTGMGMSAVSHPGTSASRHGVSNFSLLSAHLGRDAFASRSSFFTRSTTRDPFRNSGLNRDFHRGLFNDHDRDDFAFRRGFLDFDDFGFRCFGCGFGFGFGPAFGFGFGWGWWNPWWDSWWWDPWWRLRVWGWVPPPAPTPVV